MKSLRKLALFLFVLTVFGIGALFSKEPVDFVADLKSMNTELNDQDITGQLRIQFQENDLIIEVSAHGLPPSMSHHQYIYGFVSNTKAECPTPQHDENGDGIVDSEEVGSATGVRLIPLHDRPTSLELTQGKFPSADKEGKLFYRQSVNRKELQKSLEEKFGITDIILEERTFILHGISADRDLPDNTLIPIACGAIRKGEWFD